MNKTQVGILILVAALGGVLTFVLYRQGETRVRENAAVMKAQQEQIARVGEEQRQLAARLGATTGASNANADVSPEIARLRSQAEGLKKRVDEVGRQTNAGAPAKAAAKKEAPKPPEYYEKLHRVAGARTRDAMAMVAAVRLYAEEHQGKAPSDTDQLASYLPKTGMPLSGTNSFDMLYEGALDALEKVPSSSLAVLRGRDVWVAPSGKPARVYGLVNGAAQIVESDDDFKSWEAEHVVGAEKR